MVRTGFLLFAVCAAAIVRAASADWSDWATSGQQALTGNSWSKATNGGDAFQYSGNGDFAFRVSYILSADGLVSGAAWGRFLHIASHTDGYEFQNGAGNPSSLVWTNGSQGDVHVGTNLDALVERDGRLDFAFEYIDAEGMLYFLVNDVVVDSAAIDINAWVTFSGGTGSRSLDRIFKLDGSVSYEYAFSTTRVPESEVPEPTALALLALGAGALVLRRRAER